MLPQADFQIAIDGPVASGKGTVARRVAAELGFLYLDTGAMYRISALLALQAHQDLQDEFTLAKFVAQITFSLQNTVLLANGKDFSREIRQEVVGANASKIATYAAVREVLVQKQQALAAHNAIVMEGRDITYRVLPNANLKIFLTASETVRAQRRFLELQRRGVQTTLEKVQQDIHERDQRDAQRVVDPYRIVPDAWVLDTTELTIDEVVAKICHTVAP